MSEEMEFIEDGFPDIERLSDAWENIPEVMPTLIEGVLRQGHKMLLAGPSKAGKSFCLIELCIAFAENVDWLGFKCAQGKVLYVNLELDRASCLHRFKDVYEAMDIMPEHLKNIDIWNLRGRSVPMDKLAPKLIRRAKNKGFIAIVIDPIYKVITGDENNASKMSEFVSFFDRIASEVGCGVIYCHHHSKGDQSWKKSMDRASGSGVFARDPDALLDVSELELPKERQQDGVTAWRITGTLREFKTFPPVDVWFNYPLHTVEHFDSKVIAPHHELPAWRRAMNGRKTKEQKLQKRKRRLEAAFDICSANDHITTVSELAEYLGLSDRSIRNSIDEHEGFTRENGIVYRDKRG